MKKLILLIFLFVQGGRIYAQKLKGNNEFVEFAHSGIINKIIKPLFISTTELQLKLDKEQEEKLKTILQYSHRKITSEEYIKNVCESITTNQETFSAIRQFIIHHQQFYTNDANVTKGAGIESYDIYIDNRMHYYIKYKLKNIFFYDLCQFLKKGNYDKKVVEALSSR